jgi:DNA-binding HxlR family transcriptional regulator
MTVRAATRDGASTATRLDGRACGVARAAALLGDVWTLLLVRDLSGGPKRFTQLQASTGISPRVLTDRLKVLVDRGIATRAMYAEIPPRVEYTLTAKGAAAVPVVEALRAYGDAWLMDESCDRAMAELIAVPPVTDDV